MTHKGMVKMMSRQIHRIDASRVHISVLLTLRPVKVVSNFNRKHFVSSRKFYKLLII